MAKKPARHRASSLKHKSKSLLVTGLLSYYAVPLILKEILNNCLAGVAATILITFIQTFYVTFVFPWCIKRWEVQAVGERNFG
jgi:hypothetical protein